MGADEYLNRVLNVEAPRWKLWFEPNIQVDEVVEQARCNFALILF